MGRKGKATKEDTAGENHLIMDTIQYFIFLFFPVMSHFPFLIHVSNL